MEFQSLPVDLKQTDNNENYERLLTFKEKSKDITYLSVIVLSNLGFLLNGNKIKCSKCSFLYSNLKIQSIYSLVEEHIKFIDKQRNKCTFKASHNQFLESIWKSNKKISNLNKKEHLLKILETNEGRLASFQDVEIEISAHKLAENGFYLHKDINLNANLRQIKCYYCDYECIIFRKGLQNNFYEDPAEDHEKKSPDCEIIKKNRENKTEIDGLRN